MIDSKLQTPNWENLMPKARRSQQGRQPSEERENYRKIMNTTTTNNNNNKFSQKKKKKKKKKNTSQKLKWIGKGKWCHRHCQYIKKVLHLKR